MDQGGLLALDLATIVGWAYADRNYVPSPTDLEVVAGKRPQVPDSGALRMGAKGCSIGRLGIAFDEFMSDRMTLFKPAIVVFEAPFYGDATLHQQARKAFGMAFNVEVFAHRFSAQVFEVSNSSVKKHMTGSGRADKQMVIDACYKRGWKPKDDNEADALGLLDYSLAILARKFRRNGP